MFMNHKHSKEVQKLKSKMEDKRPEINFSTVKRLLKIVTKEHKLRLILVFICIVISSVVKRSAVGLGLKSI